MLLAVKKEHIDTRISNTFPQSSRANKLHFPPTIPNQSRWLTWQ